MSATPNDPQDSLRRVLTNIKADAREMRKEHTNGRLNPKKPEPAPEEELLTLDVPEEALTEPGAAADEKPSDKERDAIAIRKLISRA